MNFNNKKLLILGANPETVPLIKAAQSLGVFTAVTDYDPDAYAKLFADKSYNVDGLDEDGIVELVKKEKIDGVIVGVADPLISTYQKVCERLNFPSYATAEQVNVFTNKYYFKRKCEKFGIQGIPEFKIDENLNRKDLDKIKYPVLVKPADSNSGKGMTLCNGEHEINSAVEKAIFYSPTKRIIAEKFMTCDDMFLYYTFKDGKYYLSATADRYTCKEQGKLSPVCLGGTYPSKYTGLYFETIHEKMINMFESLEVKNGVLMVTAFVEEGNFYVYDPGFRLQGEAPNLLIENINSFDQRKMLVKFALCGSMGDEMLDEIDDCYFKNKFASTIWFLLKEGQIGKISGMDEIIELPQVVKVVQRMNEGDIIIPDFVGTEKQVLARVYVVCDDKNEFKKTADKIHSLIDVKDTQNNNMLLKCFDYKNI